MFNHTAYHGRNVHELFISSSSRVVRIHNLPPGAASLIGSILHANSIMLPVSAWSLHEQFGGPPPGRESSIWCVFRTHDDACRVLQLDGAQDISVSTALEDDLQPFTKLRRFELQDEVESSLHINFNLPSLARAPSPTPVLYSTDELYAPKSGFLTPPTPTTALSSSASSSEGTSPPSSTLSLFGARSSHGEPCLPLSHSSTDVGFMMSTNPPSPRSAFKRGDWMCATIGCATHNFGRNPACISCGAPRPLALLPTKPTSDYDRYFDQRAPLPLPLSPPPPRRCNPLTLPLVTGLPQANVASPTQTFATSHRASQPPRLPSILTPSGRAFARGGRIQNVSTLPGVSLVMFWPDNEPLPQPCQIRPPFSPGSHPPIMNTGNKGPLEHQPGDWRKVCQTCFPFADGNADGVSAAVQTERINALAQIAGSTMAHLEPLGMLAGKQASSISLDSNPASGLGLSLGARYDSSPIENSGRFDMLTASFASMNVNDRRGSVDQGIGRSAPATTRALRTRQSDAGLRLSNTPFSTRPRASDAGLHRVIPDAGLTFGLPAVGTAGARRVSDGNIWATGLGAGDSQGLWPTYGARA
ncbi:Zf-RanBP domain-containing protein [Ceratobasidium sp. AG-Ba]|nr:Zf-RanBP domain-containing protein [Ceratobasidium sp. AG-Ba]